MQFLRTIFWVLLAVVAVAFGMKNAGYVTLSFWSGYAADVRLPLLLAIVFLLGLIPPWLLHRITRWSLGRKLEAANRQLIESRSVVDQSGVSMPSRALPSAATGHDVSPGVS